jgi:hypothetical protein
VQAFGSFQKPIAVPTGIVEKLDHLDRFNIFELAYVTDYFIFAADLFISLHPTRQQEKNNQ